MRRYYNGVATRPTTRCCSAVALIAGSCVAAAQAPSTPTRPLFPAQTAWTLALNNPLTAPPGFSGSDGYFPIGGDRVVAYDVRTGVRRWIATAPTALAPVAGDGLVFIVEPAALTARHQTDGSPAWRLPFSDPLAARLVWDDGWLVAAAESGTIRAFRAVDGALLWQRDLSAAASGAPELAGDRLYVPTLDDRLVALRFDTGEPVWERRLGGAPGGILALGDRLYVGSTDNYFYCLRTSDGEVVWRWRTGADVVGRPVADDRRVYFVSLDNVLRALTLGGGSQQWRRLLPLRPSAGPLMTAGTLVVSGVAPSVLAFSTGNGNPAGTLTPRGELASPPYIVDTAGAPTVVVVTRDLEKGATVTAFTRSFEPAVVPMAPLPNPTPVRAPTPDPPESP